MHIGLVHRVYQIGVFTLLLLLFCPYIMLGLGIYKKPWYTDVMSSKHTILQTISGNNFCLCTFLATQVLSFCQKDVAYTAIYSMRQKNVSKIVPFRSLKRYLPYRLFPVFSSNTVRFSRWYRSVPFRFVSFRSVSFRFVCAPSQWSSNALEI